MSVSVKTARRRRRKLGIRKKVLGTPQRPRLTIYRTLKHIYAQIIDDLEGNTLVAASSLQNHVDPAGNRQGADVVGKQLAVNALAAGINQVAFDRNGFKFHGRIESLAHAARKGGLKF